MHLLPFAGLLTSLATFLLSTRQFKIPLRLLIWITGALLLAGSVWAMLAGPDTHSLTQIALTHPQVLLGAFEGNWRTISAAFSPLLDILCMATALVALVGLAAFTPGELVERTLRPVVIALVGAVVGATAALALAGIGFGTLAKREIYIGVLDTANIHDGDTVSMGDISLRIWGIDAPELTQPCKPPEESSPCGDLARQQLVKLVAGQLVVCKKPNTARGIPRESFGRPLVTCTREPDQRDIGQEMVRTGCASAFRDNGDLKSNYGANENTADQLNPDQRACPPFLRPDVWRKQS